MRLLITVLFGLAYAVTTVIVGFAITVAGILRCNEGCEHATNWTADTNSWQWSVVFALGPISLLAGLATLAVAFAVGRTVFALTALGLHAVALIAATTLLLHSPEFGRTDVGWVPVTIGCGLVYALRTPRQRAGMRRE